MANLEAQECRSSLEVKVSPDFYFSSYVELTNALFYQKIIFVIFWKTRFCRYENFFQIVSNILKSHFFNTTNKTEVIQVIIL